MRIETYRSLVGRSATFVGDYLERRAAWIASAGSGDDDDDERCRFGRVDGIVVDEDAVDVASSLLSSSSSSCSSFGLACELRPTDVEDSCDRLRRLRPARPLDAVVVRVPRPPNNDDDHDDAAATRWWTEEYLPRALPVASRALEEGLVRDGGVGRRNAHGNPASDHVHGVAHAFVGADLDALATLADVFPPTRFVLDAARPTDDDDERAVLDADDGRGGLPLGLEAVAQSTDLLRVSPSTFGGRSGGPHGLLGPGTLFGEVQCAHEAQGATRTRVVLDVDDDDVTADLARRVRAAFDASATWRAGAPEREAEAVARRRSTTIVARGSAAALGLPYDDDRLTVAAVERRWRELAFRTHPDTADSDSTTITASFVELRRHYAALSQELRRREASTNNRETSRDADQRGGL